MAEPTVQVPVSQVTQWRNDLQAMLPPGTYAILRELDALLSQPTPSAEAMSADEFSARWRGADTALRRMSEPAEPPRIEDMAPGTTFTAILNGGKRLRTYTVTERRILTESEGGAYALGDIDPSTIRDVQPPARREEE